MKDSMCRIYFILFIYSLYHLACQPCLYDEITVLNKCKVCSYSIDGCLKCILDSDDINIVCVECKPGYTKSLEKCIKNCQYTHSQIPTNNSDSACEYLLWANEQYEETQIDLINHTQRNTTTDEYSALISFFNSLNGNAWKRKDNWLIGDPCLNKWYGIKCNLRGNIVSIKYVNNRLHGVIPDNVGSLKNLRRFIIYNDQFDYMNVVFQMSLKIFNLPKIKEIILRNINLKQKIQNNFNLSSHLGVLDISNNYIESSLNSILNSNNPTISNLKKLNLSNNKISGNIGILSSFPLLETIELQNNYLVESILALENKDNLLHFDLRNNTFTGAIDQKYFDTISYPKLIYIGLAFNKISNIPIHCINYPICPLKILSNARSIYDKDFSLTPKDISYLLPRQ